MNEATFRFILIAIVARLRELTSVKYRVPMKALSDAYAPDYYELMVMNKDVSKIISEIERMIHDDDNS